VPSVVNRVFRRVKGTIGRGWMKSNYYLARGGAPLPADPIFLFGCTFFSATIISYPVSRSPMLKAHGSLVFCRVVACGALKLVQQATLAGLTRPFLHCNRQRVANVAFASGEIQKNQAHYITLSC
jgi:hypothetical protein